MTYTVRRTMLAITTSGAISLFGAFVATSANAATMPAPAATHAVTVTSQAPNSLGFCLTHWQDNNGNDLPYATFTCYVTSDTLWEGWAHCTDGTFHFTREHVGAGSDQINCPGGSVVADAGVNFLN